MACVHVQNVEKILSEKALLLERENLHHDHIEKHASHMT